MTEAPIRTTTHAVNKRFSRWTAVIGSFLMLVSVARAQVTDFGILTWAWDCGDPLVTVTFSTNVNAALATDIGNYSFSPAATINSIAHTPPSAVVQLNVSTLSTSGMNTLSVTNITSLDGVALDPQYSQTFIYCHDHPPTILCPDDLIVACVSGTGFTTNSIVEVFDADGDPLDVVWNINGADIATNSVPAGNPVTSDTDSLTHTYPVGTNSVIVSVTDGSYTNSCEFRVIVHPAGLPIIDCPPGPFEILGADCANPEVFDLSSLATIHGDCYTTNDFTFTHSPPIGTPLPHGTNIVTLTIDGPNGFQQICDVEFIVDCPPDPCEVLCPDPGFQINIVDCPALMPDVTPHVTLSGNCDPALYSLTQSIPAGTTLSNGTYWVNVTVTGPGGFEEHCRITVAVDMAPPRLDCRDQGVFILPMNDDCEAVLPAMPYTITPGCTPLIDLVVTQTPPAGTLLGSGIHWVTLEVFDPATGQSIYCRFQVQVVDRLPPLVQCPDLDPVPDCEAEIPDIIPNLIIDPHCDDVADLVIVQTPPTGTIVGPGSHTITVTVTDPAGNTSQCTTIFEVLGTGFATPIVGLRNTGVDPAGALLPIHSLDPHYDLVASANPSLYPGPNTYVMNPRPGAWLPNTPVSQWISIASNMLSHTAGTYVYRIEFTLPATFTSASISGLWASDNNSAIFFNGNPTGFANSFVGFGFMTPFTITTGFVPGNNVLEFHVDVISLFSGLHVTDLEGTVYTCEDVPPCEPPSVTITPSPSQTVAWGGSATFTTAVSGTPTHSYQWYFNGAPIIGANGPTLTVSPATFADSGLYSVMVNNPCGEILSSEVQLRVRRRWGVLIDHWHIGRPGVSAEPLNPAPIIGDFGTPLEPLPPGPDPIDPYASTAVAARFDRTTAFGIPGPNGVPVDVMQFTFGLPETGYTLAYDPAEITEQTMIMDLYVPETVCMLPLWQVDIAGEDEVVYLCTDDQPAPEPGERVLQIPLATWTRVVLVRDTEQHDFSGYTLTPQGLSEQFSLNGSVPAGTGVHRFLPSSADDRGTVYLRSLSWYQQRLSTFEMAAQGPASAADATVVDPIISPAQLEVAPAGTHDTLRLRWRTADFIAQQSTNLIDWESIPAAPALVTDTADEVEYQIDLPATNQPMQFYRAVSSP